MKSMTGYGKGIAENEKIRITVELRSVNHKQLDISVKSPRALISLEDTIRKSLSQRLNRGHIDVYVNYEQKDESGKIRINYSVIDKYVSLASELEKRGIKNDISFIGLMKLPDVMSLEEEDENIEDTFSLILKSAVNRAIDALIVKRENEGELIKADFVLKIKEVSEHVQTVEGLAASTVPDYKAKLTSRVEELLNDTPLNREKLENEIAFFADRICIDEEITRLKVHIKNFYRDLEKTVSVGRELDCLMQEMNREVNTIGSKANDSAITEQVIILKGILEKIREQVQNIE